MKNFRTASLADQVFDKLEDDIVYGIYKRGEILTELKLAENLGVSRTPIREALRRLEQERLIEDTGKGSVVLGITKEDLMDIMDGTQGTCRTDEMIGQPAPVFQKVDIDKIYHE